jgi:hypothetical protein
VAAVAVIAVSFSAATYIHLRRVDKHLTYFSDPTAPPKVGLPSLFKGGPPKKHPSWEDPVAVLLALGGLSVAARIVAAGRSA